uniref:Uncharacterized protein n=1 Tax=uncultured gamma proteobacterium HF0010_16J05 TaxID=710981 RepID=E0XR26_9GAMM|nr:hypothetical protein [uncultured gamma proteobacterium HF0010_16J05]
MPKSFRIRFFSVKLNAMRISYTLLRNFFRALLPWESAKSQRSLFFTENSDADQSR